MTGWNRLGRPFNQWVAIYTGMRRGELLKLRRSQVDFGLNVINVKQTKTGNDRTVPMHVSVTETLIGLCEGLSDDGKTGKLEKKKK
ncbi:MAG: tyrosine-type recombinase/integrase [Pyrinomonadaceae bacterium]